jgi:phage terminase Nu1 subunit (DNA packaging protein)
MPRKGTIDDICNLFGITPTAIRELASQGIVKRIGRGAYDLDASTTAYLAHLRQGASGRGGELASERARLAREQADQVAMRNRLARGELVEVGTVQATWIGIARSIRAGVLALPTRVQSRLPHLTAFDVAEIEREARAVLTELANAE